MPFRFKIPCKVDDLEFGFPLPPEDSSYCPDPPPEDLVHPREYYNAWRVGGPSRDVKMENNDDVFQLTLDVQNFKPTDLSVRAAPGYIVIEGSHEERKDNHGFITRQFTRKYHLPESCDPETVEASISPDGLLVIFAPKKPMSPKPPRDIPVICTGRPRMADRLSKLEEKANKTE